MRIRGQLLLMLFIPMLGCRGGGEPPPFQPVADVKQLMVAILEPAAEGYWDAVGSIDDVNGTTSFAPRSSEDWTAVRNHALVIAESGNLLMMPAHALGRGDWIAMSTALVEAGRRAIAAAEAKDTTAVFDVGAEVYEACSKCHAVYAVQLQRPGAQDE